jgi:hypothetical protein
MIRRAAEALLICAAVVLVQAVADRVDRYNEQQERQAQAERDKAERWRVLDHRGREMVSYDRMVRK